MKVEKFLFLGYQGRISKLLDGRPEQPIIEFETLLTEQCTLSVTEKMTTNNLIDFFQTAYQRWGKYGFMGDIISVTVLETSREYIYSLNFIGRLAFHKPGLAVDLLTVICIKDGNYFIGIKRRFDPGKGKLALPGGFLDVNDYHLDTPLETIVHEAKEEIGLNIKVINILDLSTYELVEASVEIEYNFQKFAGKLIPLGIMPTGDNEKMPSIGLKRVYHTTAYALVLDMTQSDLDERGIDNWLKAGDDASKLEIINLSKNHNPEFGLTHHEKIFSSFMKKFVKM